MRIKLIFSLCRYDHVVMSLCLKCEPGFTLRESYICAQELRKDERKILLRISRVLYLKRAVPNSYCEVIMISNCLKSVFHSKATSKWPTDPLRTRHITYPSLPPRILATDYF